MRSFAIATLAALSIYAVSASAASLCDSEFVNPEKNWYPSVDNFGSSLDTAKAFFVAGAPTVVFSHAAMKSGTEDYPYTELVCETEGSIADAKKITVSYTSDRPMIIKLIQKELNAKAEGGNDSYAFYQYTVPTSATFKTVTVPFADFEQPDWSESQSVKFNAATVSAINFTPEFADDEAGKAKIAIKSLILTK